MRIIGGSKRGATLLTPQGDDIRPTTDKVRLAIFNALFSRDAVRDAVVLDAFCGTGALGLEALSQGAASCQFFDSSPVSLALARKNAAALEFTPRCHFGHHEAQHIKAKPVAVAPFTLVFLDPPYGKNLVAPVVTALQKGEWLAKDAWLVIESERDAAFTLSGFACDFDKHYGIVRITLWRTAAL
ncbi:MAG: 16S rRNA (guanine(966)-N(2))-methyltransferase RsmD [Pseudobdellovibrionaceae bacterium]